MKTFLASAGILALVLVISCGKEKQVKTYNGHFVTNVTLHPALEKALVAEKKYDPAQNCIQLVEYSRTPDKSSRSDFYVLFSPNPCPAGNETVEQFAFASEVQGMEQTVNTMRMYNRLNELTAYTAVRPTISSGWLERKVGQGEKVSGYQVAEICNYSSANKVTTVSGCELRIDGGRFAIPRDTSLTAKEDQDQRLALEQLRATKSAADSSREDVTSHLNELHDAQMARINEIHTAQLKRMDDLEAKVIKDLSTKLEEEIRVTNMLLSDYYSQLTTDIKNLSDKNDKQHDAEIKDIKNLSDKSDTQHAAEIKRLKALQAKLKKVGADVKTLDTTVKSSAGFVVVMMTLENWLMKLHIDGVGAGVNGRVDALGEKIAMLRADSIKEIQAVLKRSTAEYNFYSMIEQQASKVNLEFAKKAAASLKKSNEKLKGEIDALTKTLELLGKKSDLKKGADAPDFIPPAK